MPLHRYLVLTVLLMLVPGCTRPVATSPAHKIESSISVPGAVGFDITQTKREDGSILVQATYPAQGRLAKFNIEFGPARELEGKTSKDFDARFGKGRFVARAGSDATVLLGDLRKALEAKSTPSK